MTSDPLEIALIVTHVLEDLDVPYAIVGSIASSAYGEMRATMDVDMVADLTLARVKAFTTALGDAFYHDEEMIRSAVEQRSHFNIIHLEGMLKVDFFLPREEGLDRSELSRRRRLVLAERPERSAFLASPEDVLLHKLEWYRQGGQVSDRQWRDVLGILEVQADRLDISYLRTWAEKMGLSSLLDRALNQLP